MNAKALLRRLAFSAVAFANLVGAADAAQDGAARPKSPPAAGVNLSGAEYGVPNGKAESDFHFPAEEDYAWARAKGFTFVRLPFLWERIQPALEKELNADHLEMLATAVHRARAHDLSIVLDVHNYGRWRGAAVGTQIAPDQAFADLWRRLARKFGGDPHVLFGLMNEPHDMPLAQWASAAQAAIDAIRKTGACNQILVPGANWTGAHSWNADDGAGSNASLMAKIRDRGPHLFEFHQYLDSDWSGEHAECRKPEEVVAALANATTWLRANAAKGFLGEFGAPANPQCLAGLDAMLAHMSENSDVWAGWAYWAAGAWWPTDYKLSIQPLRGEDRPQMATLAKWIGKTPAPAGCAAPGSKPAGPKPVKPKR